MRGHDHNERGTTFKTLVAIPGGDRCGVAPGVQCGLVAGQSGRRHNRRDHPVHDHDPEHGKWQRGPDIGQLPQGPARERGTEKPVHASMLATGRLPGQPWHHASVGYGYPHLARDPVFSWPGSGRSSGQRRQACSCWQGRAVGTRAGAEVELPTGEVLLELGSFVDGGFAVLLARALRAAPVDERGVVAQHVVLIDRGIGLRGGQVAVAEQLRGDVHR